MEFRKRSECEDSFDYVGSSSSWTRSSSKRDLRTNRRKEKGQQNWATLHLSYINEWIHAKESLPSEPHNPEAFRQYLRWLSRSSRLKLNVPRPSIDLANGTETEVEDQQRRELIVIEGSQVDIHALMSLLEDACGYSLQVFRELSELPPGTPINHFDPALKRAKDRIKRALHATARWEIPDSDVEPVQYGQEEEDEEEEVHGDQEVHEDQEVHDEQEDDGEAEHDEESAHENVHGSDSTDSDDQRESPSQPSQVINDDQFKIPSPRVQCPKKNPRDDALMFPADHLHRPKKQKIKKRRPRTKR